MRNIFNSSLIFLVIIFSGCVPMIIDPSYMKARTGNVDAQYEVAHSYFIGTTGYPNVTHWGIQNYTKAFYWFQKAAEQGMPKAQYDLGRMYGGNNGKPYDEIPVDKEKAFFWLMKSAEQHYSPSYAAIAVAYLKGEGIEQDFNKSAYWYEQSEKMDYYWSKGKAELIRKELIEREQRAEQGEAQAQYELGIIFNNEYLQHKYTHLDIPHDYKKAMYWFKKAAQQNYLPAIEFGKLFYLNNEGTLDDYQNGFLYFSKAANEGDPEAQYILSKLYYGLPISNEKYNELRQNFIQTIKNDKLHLFWLKKAAEQGHEKAIEALKWIK